MIIVCSSGVTILRICGCVIVSNKHAVSIVYLHISSATFSRMQPRIITSLCSLTESPSLAPQLSIGGQA